MNNKFIGISEILLLVLMLFIFGCSQKTTVILMPDPNGHVGHVVVASDAGSVELDQPGEATTVADMNTVPSIPKIRKEEAISREFSEALAKLPNQPEHFILYFEKASIKLTPASHLILESIFEDISSLQSYNISVIGHSDTAGNKEYNLHLSQERAEAVRKLLVGRGVQAQQIKATSHGEENPLIKTGDNVAEPENRRVEIVVR